MDEAIVNQRVDDAIKQDANADEGRGPPCRIAEHPFASQHKHRNAHRRTNDAIKIVLLQQIVMRLMVVAVPRPAPAMHDIFVARPSDPFHRGNAGEDDQYGDESSHMWPI